MDRRIGTLEWQIKNLDATQQLQNKETDLLNCKNSYFAMNNFSCPRIYVRRSPDHVDQSLQIIEDSFCKFGLQTKSGHCSYRTVQYNFTVQCGYIPEATCALSKFCTPLSV